MKAFTIAVAGKGGVGKTTVAALLIEALRPAGPVLAVDADPNCNLGEALGISVEKTIGQLRDEFLEKISELPPGVPKDHLLELGLHQCLVEDNGVDFLAMGHGEGPRCYCMVNHVLRRVIEALRQNYRYVVLDNEAGMEHLSRRTTQDVDALLVVAEPRPVSLRSAGRIRELAEELRLRIAQKFLVLNRVEGPLPKAIAEELQALELPLLGMIPEDPEVEGLWARGRSLRELSPQAPARRAIQDLLQKLLGKEG